MGDEVSTERLAKLPALIQNFISGLQARIRDQENDIDGLRAIVTAGPENSTVFATADGGDTERPLGRNVSVRFKSDKGEFTVSLQEDGSLLVDAFGPDVLVAPITPYSVAIHTKEG